MIDKVDRPEAPRPYQIREAKQTKEDQHQQQEQKEEMERKYQKEIEGSEWQKFDQRTTVIKPIRVQRDSIQRLRFRGASFHSGIGTLQVDVLWKDGRITRNALVLITRLEDYIHLKKLVPGKEVPEAFWAKNATVELGIPQTIAKVGRFPGRNIEGQRQQAGDERKKRSLLQKAGVTDPILQKTNWGLLFLYLFLFALMLLGIVLILL